MKSSRFRTCLVTFILSFRRSPIAMPRSARWYTDVPIQRFEAGRAGMNIYRYFKPYFKGIACCSILARQSHGLEEGPVDHLQISHESSIPHHIRQLGRPSCPRLANAEMTEPAHKLYKQDARGGRVAASQWFPITTHLLVHLSPPYIQQCLNLFFPDFLPILAQASAVWIHLILSRYLGETRVQAIVMNPEMILVINSTTVLQKGAFILGSANVLKAVVPRTGTLPETILVLPPQEQPKTPLVVVKTTA